MTIDTTNLCSHLQKKLFEPDGKKILILAGKAQPKIIREDKLNELINKTI